MSDLMARNLGSPRGRRTTRVAVCLLALLTWGCRNPGIEAAGGFLSGRVLREESGTVRLLQATMAEVAQAATVSLIDTSANQTVATTVTAGDGSFVLVWPTSFNPGSQVYYLEAIKGLNNNAVGSDATRVRTMLNFVNKVPSSSLTGTGNSGVVIGKMTTAVSALADLKALSQADRLALMNTVQYDGAGGVNISLIPSNILSQSDVNTCNTLVGSLLDANADPLATLAYDPATGPTIKATGTLKPPSIASLDPSPAQAGTSLTINGADFGSSAAKVTVTLNGSVLPITSFASNRIIVTLPSGAATGNLVVTGSLGSSTTTCYIVPKVSGVTSGT